MNLKKIFIFASFCAMSLSLSAQQSFTLDLYSGKPKVKSSDAKDTARVWVYLPEESRNTGRRSWSCAILQRSRHCSYCVEISHATRQTSGSYQ